VADFAYEGKSVTGKEFLRRLREGEAAAPRHQLNRARGDALRRRRLDRFRQERARATSWRRRAAGFVIFGLVGVCIGVLTGVFLTEWLIRRWPDRLPPLRPRSSVVDPLLTTAPSPATETRPTGRVAEIVAPASVPERRVAEIAFVRARQLQSVDGLVRAGEAFATLDDHAVVEQCIRAAGRLVGRHGSQDEEVRERLARLENRLTTARKPI
jgi:hypothetical protein